MVKKNRLLIIGLIVVGAMFFFVTPHIRAASIIEVNTNLDVSADDGVCTFREAVVAANTDTASGGTGGECIAGSGADTIEFNISGPADFTVVDRNSVTQDGYSIKATNSLPQILEEVTIDGYSQPGSLANDAVSPAPLNGTLLIEISGELVPGYVGFIANADSVKISGLVINDWTYHGVEISGDDIKIAGNYIGTDATGSVAKPNGDRGVSGWDDAGDNAMIGGTNPEDRNIISGNGVTPQGSGIGIGAGHDNWRIQGNYIGLAADGVTAIPNAQVGGAGSPSIDYVSGTLVGGDVVGAANVISGNNGIGIAPYEAPNTTIQGNYIGTDYTGTVAVGNIGLGINPSSGSDNMLIGGNTPLAGNIISGNVLDGIYGSENDGMQIIGNTIGTDASGTIDLGNGQSGIGLSTVTDTIIDSNTIMNNPTGISLDSALDGMLITDNNVTSNTIDGVAINDSEEVSVYGNIIMDNAESGLKIADSFDMAIGSSNIADKNVISNNSASSGILLTTISGTTENIVIQGNYIGTKLDGTIDSSYTQNDGISIDHGVSNVLIGGDDMGQGNLISGNDSNGISVRNGPNPEASNITMLMNIIVNNGELGIDLSDNGVTVNDAGDVDDGPNSFLNYPEYINVTEFGGDTTIDYILDVPAGDYRIEFFSNASADVSGNGEGETFIGYQDVTSAGNGVQMFSQVLSGINHENLALTATERNLSNSSTFGATSEFGADASPLSDIEITKTLDNPQSVTAGQDLTYTITFTNHGYSPVNLNDFNGNAVFNVLFSDLADPDLTLVGTSNSNVSCSTIGTGAWLGPALANHSSYNINMCAYTGPNAELGSGESIIVPVTFTLSPTSDMEFSNYAVNFIVSDDPDQTEIGQILSSGQDIIDLFSDTNVNNFSVASYPVPVSVSEPDLPPAALAGIGVPNTGLGAINDQSGVKWVKFIICVLSLPYLVFIVATRKFVKRCINY